MTAVPRTAPRCYKVDSHDYGQSSIIQALHYAQRCRELGDKHEERYHRSRNDSREIDYKHFLDHYRREEPRWIQCALNTARAAQKRLNDEHVARVKMARIAQAAKLELMPVVA